MQIRSRYFQFYDAVQTLAQLQSREMTNIIVNYSTSWSIKVSSLWNWVHLHEPPFCERFREDAGTCGGWSLSRKRRGSVMWLTSLFHILDGFLIPQSLNQVSRWPIDVNRQLADNFAIICQCPTFQWETYVNRPHFIWIHWSKKYCTFWNVQWFPQRKTKPIRNLFVLQNICFSSLKIFIKQPNYIA